VLNGGESDVDCGGDDCDPCGTDQACEVGDDCESSVCTELVCQPPTCTDFVVNGTETAVDCGGDCPACGVGAACNDGSDCDSSVCDDNLCVGPGCVDGVRNGSETDVDCGGADCGPCALGDDCRQGDDCSTGACQELVCVAAICGDGRVGDGEACDDGTGNSDTVTDACRTSCQDPSCGDGVRDTGEACDQGALNSATVANACRPGCVLPACGDSVVDSGEQCDRGASNSNTAVNGCRTTCQNAFCGDGVRDAGETCDAGSGNSDSVPGACRLNCLPARCGDGVVDAGEACDNGAANGVSSCSLECVRVSSACDDSTADYCVILPYGSDADLDVVWEDLVRPSYDLGFIVDISGSMLNAATAHRTVFASTPFANAINARPGTRIGLAESEGLDCGFSDVEAFPLIVRQRMTSSLSNFLNSASGLDANGGGTEHMSEALFQYATGRGRLNTSGCAVAASNTVLSPAFDPLSGLVAGVADGTEGGIGFRASTLRPTFFATDEDDTARGSAFEHGASFEEGIDALENQAINVFGLWFNSTSAPLSSAMRAWASTSAVPPCAWNGSRPAGCSAGQCCTGVNGASASPSSGLCPLAYEIDADGSDSSTASQLSAAMLDALTRWESFGGVNVRLRVRGESSWNSCLLQSVEATGTTSSNGCTPNPVAGRAGAVGFDDGYTRVPFGSDVPFSVSLANECLRPTAETTYRANLELRVGQVVLQSRTLDVIVPPRSACTGPLCAIRCGNGALEPGEQCDDGDNVDTNGCSNTCAPNRCGDGVVNDSLSSRTFNIPTVAGTPVRRVCDDGATCPEGTCNVQTLPDAPEHGFCQARGFDRASTVTYGGATTTVSGALTSSSWTCSDFVCTFTPSIAPYSCGRHEVLTSITCVGGGTEECDGTAGCSAECVLPICGNGVQEAGEQCDDGNDVDNDFCSLTCRTPVCGDGVISGAEQCDDAALNSNNPGACRTNCTFARCGDGVRDTGEACDDGNASNTDTCTTLCRPPGCGDGVITAPETCDDLNAINWDTCPNTCRLPACGDGIVQPARGEACDDGNANNSDGCNTSCQHAPAAVTCSFINLGSAEGIGVANGTTVGAGNDFRPPDFCFTTVPGTHTADDLAFLWTAPRNGTFRISTEGSAFDTVISASRVPVGTSACPATADICNDDFRVSGSSTSRLQGEVSLSVTRGERILIVVDGYSSTNGAYRLSITP
jgi:cysteine-rich repeat protein